MIFDTNNDCSILAVQKEVKYVNGDGISHYNFKIIEVTQDANGNEIYPQLGTDIESANGNSIVLNGDGTIVALSQQGYCQAYQYRADAQNWIQYGNRMFTSGSDGDVNKICIKTNI